MKIKYSLPVDRGKIEKILIKKSRTHKIYKHSIDFIVPIGTPIKAAANGIVIDVKNNSDKGSVSRKYEKFENFIEIRHKTSDEYSSYKNDEYSYYGHLKKNGVLVKVGDKVKAGRIIGYSGDTGWLANVKEPHLHFMVGKYTYKNIKIKFKKLKVVLHFAYRVKN